jgi:methylmalonyl-CoA/ethylmalonyl-CoA epimerase
MADQRILLDHLALAVRDVGDAVPFLVGALGGRAFEAGPGRGFRWWQWAFEGGGRIEILEPDGPGDGFLYRFLDARGPGPHHLTFKVSDLRAAAKRAGEASAATRWSGTTLRGPRGRRRSCTRSRPRASWCSWQSRIPS